MQTVASLSARSAVVQTQLGSRRVATSRTVRRAAAVPMAAAKSFYELSATDIDGNDVVELRGGAHHQPRSQDASEL